MYMYTKVLEHQQFRIDF